MNDRNDMMKAALDKAGTTLAHAGVAIAFFAVLAVALAFIGACRLAQLAGLVRPHQLRPRPQS